MDIALQKHSQNVTHVANGLIEMGKMTLFFIIEIVFALIFLVGYFVEIDSLALVGGLGVFIVGLIFKFFVITE